MQDIAKQLLLQYSPSQISQLINYLSPQAPTGSMSAREFDRIREKMERPRNSYSDTSIAIARLYFVEGASTSEAAKELGVTYQCAHRVLKRIKMNLIEP